MKTKGKIFFIVLIVLSLAALAAIYVLYHLPGSARFLSEAEKGLGIQIEASVIGLVSVLVLTIVVSLIMLCVVSPRMRRARERKKPAAAGGLAERRGR